MQPYPIQKKQTPRVILSLENVAVRIGKSLIFSDLNWTLREGESWAVFGPNAAGKSTFLRLVRGDIWPSPGQGRRVFFVDGFPQESPLRFRRHTGLVSSELLDRYRIEGWNLSGLETVCTGFTGTPLLHEKPDSAQLDRAHEIMTILGIEDLAARQILSMSLGQAKKILIARALVHRPMFLFLDEACSGLDVSARRAVLDVVQRVAETGVQIFYASHNVDDRPPALTHALRLESGRIVSQGMLDKTMTAQAQFAKTAPPIPEGSSAPSARPPRDGFLIEVQHADVSLNGKRMLTGIRWTLKQGENWAVLGRNGSGKTTLLKLLAGEILPVWGGSVRRFGNKGVRTLWDIRRHISFVSGDLQASFQCPQTGLELVLSGFFGSIGLHDEPTPGQTAEARSWMDMFDIGDYADRDVRTLSYGLLRRLLIVRAMVRRPTVLLLDEPLAGLDAAAKAHVLTMVDSLASNGTSLVYVTHHESELLTSITHVAVLDEGRLVFQGDRQEFANSSEIHA